MKRRFMIALLIAAAIAPAVLTPRAAVAADKSADQLVPATSAVFIEVNKPTQLASHILDNALVQRIMQVPEVRQGIDNNPKLANLYAVVAVFETEMGMKWRPLVETLAAGGLCVAFDPPTKGLIVVSKSRDQATLEKFRDTFLRLARKDAQDKGRPDPVQEGQYRGITAYKAGKGYMATFGPWLIVTNQSESGQRVLDNYLDSSGPSLADDAQFKEAKAGLGRGHSAWAYVKLSTLRDLGVAKQLLIGGGKKDFGAELVSGGLAGALRKAQYATAELHTTASSAKLALSVPFEGSQVPSDRRFFFAEAGKPSADKPLKPAGTILALSAYRDLSAMWQASPDILDENAAAGIARADSALSGFFGGRAFGNDVLASFKPQQQLLVVRQDFEGRQGPVPAIKLPAFAFIFQSTKAKELGPFFKIAFQNAVGLAGIAGTQKGMPLLDLNTEPRGQGAVTSATYLPMANEPAANAKIQYNFSPALGMTGDYFMLCSTKKLAQDLVDLAQKREADQKVAASTLAELDPAPGLEALRENREQLVAQNMLQKGHGKEAAEKEIDLLFDLLGKLRGASVNMTFAKDAARLELGIQMAPPGAE
jgi:hypothetical protein